jgi:hypothetical protein
VSSLFSASSALRLIDGQGVAEEVVDVAGDALALGGDGEPLLQPVLRLLPVGEDTDDEDHQRHQDQRAGQRPQRTGIDQGDRDAGERAAQDPEGEPQPPLQAEGQQRHEVAVEREGVDPQRRDQREARHEQPAEPGERQPVAAPRPRLDEAEGQQVHHREDADPDAGEPAEARRGGGLEDQDHREGEEDQPHARLQGVQPAELPQRVLHRRPFCLRPSSAQMPAKIATHTITLRTAYQSGSVTMTPTSLTACCPSLRG